MLLSVLSTALFVQSAVMATTEPSGSAAIVRGVKTSVRNHTGGVTSGDSPPNMVLCEGGQFTMGVPKKQMLAMGEGDNENVFKRIVAIYPDHTVELEPYYLDQFEITNDQFDAYLKANNLKPPPTLVEYAWFEWKQGEKVDGIIPEGQGDHPIRAITYKEALECARWLGKRIPTEAEWAYAARKDLAKDQIHPWAGGWDKTQNANVHNSNKKSGIETWSVGSWPGDKTEAGIFDLCGNVGEWTSSPFDAYPGWEKVERKVRRQKKTYRAKFDSQQMVVRGGSVFGNEVTNNLVIRWGDYPGSAHSGVGFRCAQSALPGSDHLLEAEKTLALLNRDLRGNIDFSAESIASQQIQYVDIDRKVQNGFAAFSFARANKINMSIAKLRKASVETPQLVGILRTSRDIAYPELPKGAYAFYFSAEGASTAQKEALKAAKEEQKKKEAEERRSRRGRSKEKEEEEKKKEEEAKGEEAEPKPELTEEEKKALAEAEAVQRELEKIGAVASAPIRLSEVDVPTDQDVLRIHNESGDLVAWIPANFKQVAVHPTMFRYVAGGGNGKKAMASASSAATGDLDLAEIRFSVKTVTGSRHPEFTVLLQFESGSFEPVEPPEEDSKKSRRRSNR